MKEKKNSEWRTGRREERSEMLWGDSRSRERGVHGQGITVIDNGDR